MSKKICFKSIVEWAYKEHCCKSVDIFVKDCITNREDHIKLVRYNNVLTIVDGTTDNVLGNIYTNNVYTNKSVSEWVCSLFGFREHQYHVTVTYKDSDGDINCFEFTTGGNND